MSRRVTLTFGADLAVCAGLLVDSGPTALTVRVATADTLPVDPRTPIVAVIHAADADRCDGNSPGTEFLVTSRLAAAPGADPEIVRLAHSGYRP